MVEAMVEAIINVEDKPVKNTGSKNSIINRYQRHKLLIISIIVVGLSLSAYLNPQAFLNLWLTRDQQGVMLLKQDKPAKAALTFNDTPWVAYSFYAAGDFEQAATIFEQLDGNEAMFSHANALAHSGQYFKAVALYQTLLTLDLSDTAVSDTEIRENMALMHKIIKKLKKSPGKQTLTHEIDPKLKMQNIESKTPAKAKIESSQLWLKQVQQNPSKFLRKKFQQEHQNETK